MDQQSKLKTNKTVYIWVATLLIGLIYMVGTIWEDHTFGTHYSQIMYGLVLIGAGIFYFIKFRAVSFFGALSIGLMGLLWGLAAIHYYLARFTNIDLSVDTFYTHVLIAAIITGILILILLVRQKQMEMRYRQLFELAADPVEEAEEGFTSRPYAAGSADYSQKEIIEFAKYLSNKMIAIPHFESDKVIMTFSTGMSHFSEVDLDKTSFISFDYSGNISVGISQKDYAQYREKLTFDQLCEALANVFKKFLKEYQSGQKEIIIKHFKSENIQLKRVATVGLYVGVIVLLILLFLYKFKIG